MSATPEQTALDALAAYLLRRMGPGTVLRVVSLEVVNAGLIQEITLRPGALAVSAAPTEAGGEAEQRQEPELPLTPTMLIIVSVLKEADRPLKGEAVARRAGKNYTGHFRAALARLRERGIVLMLEAGYWLASRET